MSKKLIRLLRFAKKLLIKWYPKTERIITNMFCPMCGHKLIEIERKDPTDDWEYDDPRWDNYTPSEPDNSIWYKCTDCKCFGDDYPLHLHHPLRGIYSKPGDSWSLTWLK